MCKTGTQQANAGRVRPKLLYTKVGRIIAFQASKTRSTGNNSTILLGATSAFAGPVSGNLLDDMNKEMRAKKEYRKK